MRPIPVKLTMEGSRDSFPCPFSCSIQSTDQFAFVLPLFPVQTAQKHQIRALLLCPALAAFMEWQNLQVKIFPFPQEHLLCCTGICLVAVIMLFGVISFSVLSAFFSQENWAAFLVGPKPEYTEWIHSRKPPSLFGTGHVIPEHSRKETKQFLQLLLHYRATTAFLQV